MATLASFAIGFFAPNEYVRSVAGRRQKQIRRGLPNALDLMVVSGRIRAGTRQAVVQVAKELENAHPEISEEFSLMTLELKAGKRRIEALRNLAERTAVDDLKKLVAVLIQADRFGTSVAATLRNHAEFMRVQARQVAEEKAAKLGVKLVVSDLFLHFTVVVCRNGRAHGSEGGSGTGPDGEQYLTSGQLEVKGQSSNAYVERRLLYDDGPFSNSHRVRGLGYCVSRPDRMRRRKKTE